MAAWVELGEVVVSSDGGGLLVLVMMVGVAVLVMELLVAVVVVVVVVAREGERGGILFKMASSFGVVWIGRELGGGEGGRMRMEGEGLGCMAG